jgi:hypothetical protein
MTDVTPPPAPQAPATTDAYASTEVVPAPRKGRGVGVASLILAILAMLGDLLAIVVGVVSLASIFGNFDVSTMEFGPIIAALGAFAVVAVVVFFGGFIFAGLGLLLGIIAIASNRGRVPGVFGVIFSVLVLITHGSLAATLAGSGDALTNLIPS